MTVSALDTILRGTGLPKELWTPAQPMHSPHAAAPAISKSTQPLAKPPAPSPEPRNGQETGSTAIGGNRMEPLIETDTAAKPLGRVARKSPTQREPRPAVALSGFLEDKRPKVQLPGDGRLLSDTAADLGGHLSGVLFTRNREVVELRDGQLNPLAPQRFRSLLEKSVCCYRQVSPSGRTIQLDASLSESDARGVLAAPQFIERLRPINHLNAVRLPVIRADKRLELLPPGYDKETATLTDEKVTYSEDMPIADALAVIRDLYGEFEFGDKERSRSVAVSALLGLFAKQLIPPGELRPAFTFVKNAEGSGGTCCAACAIVPLVGDLPIGTKGKDDDEVRKSLTSAIRTGQEVIFLDNLKGTLNSAALEAFVSAPVWRDRLLGSNEVVTGQNSATVFITANGLSVSPDWRRRSLFVELHLSVERAEDRVFRRPLSVSVLRELRPQILAACWSLVKHWDARGRPGPSKSHSAFPAWAGTIGGVVEAAGFGCPFETARIAIVSDEDGENMRQLAAAMNPGVAYTAGEIVSLCRKINAFDGLIGSSDSDFGRPQRSSFGRLLSRYDNRRVGDSTFFITGSGHGKRFSVLRAEDQAGRLQ